MAYFEKCNFYVSHTLKKSKFYIIIAVKFGVQYAKTNEYIIFPQEEKGNIDKNNI